MFKCANVNIQYRIYFSVHSFIVVILYFSQQNMNVISTEYECNIKKINKSIQKH